MRDIPPFGFLLLAVVGGYLLQIIDGAELVINPTGATQNQPAGKGFALTCQANAEDTNLFSQIKWIGPKGEISEGISGPVEVTRSDNSLVLVFKSSSTDDSGMYNCSAVYDNIDRMNVAVNLIFYQDITWEDCPEQQALVINKDGKIKCRVSANPPATITWTKNNQPLEKRYVTETDGVQVSGVIEEDKGDFSVRAMVPQTGRFQYRHIKVEVYLPPEIIDLVEKAEAVEGTEATLNCKASGFPTPSYSWFDKDRRNLSNVEGFIVDSDLGILTFHKVKKNDHGTYTCLAKNPAGENEQNLQLSVIVKPEVKQFDNLTIVQDQDATFRCEATGDPLPELNIRKDGHDRPFSDPGDERISFSRRREGDRSILSMTIKRTVRSDDGLYYCTAENRGGHAEKVGHITIEFAPVMGSTPTTSVKTWNGNTVNITCIAESIPNATIKWFYNGQELRDGPIYTVYGRSGVSNLMVKPQLDFSSTKIYGTYKCEAENPHGNQFINIDLQEARPPSMVLQTNTVKRTATTLTFAFQPPLEDGGMPIRSYVVEYHEEVQSRDSARQHDWSEGTQYVLENLKPRTGYRFRFAAKNEVGIGQWSDEIRIEMPEESTPEPPKFIIPGGNTSTYPDRYQIRWTEPLDNGRKIDFFELRYFEVEQRDRDWRQVSDARVEKVSQWENAPMFEMRNLKSSTHYKVEVRAHNIMGYSQDDRLVFRTATGQGVGPDGYHGDSSGSMSAGAIAAVIIVLILIILVILDVTCYVRYQWGVLFILRNRVCSKDIANNKAKEAAVEDAKAGIELSANNGNVKVEATETAKNEKGDNGDKKSRTEVDNPAFDKEKEPLKSKEDIDKDYDGDMASEDTPMIQTLGAKDTKGNDDEKNKSPKGSKSSIAKDSLV